MAKTTAKATSSSSAKSNKLSISITSDAPAQNNAQTAASKNVIKPIASLNEKQATTQTMINTKALAPETANSIKEEANKLNALKSIDESLKSLNKAFGDFVKEQKIKATIDTAVNVGKAAYSYLTSDNNNNNNNNSGGSSKINSSEKPILVELPKEFPTEIMQAYSDMILNNKAIKDEWKTWINEAIDMSDLQKLAAQKIEEANNIKVDESEYNIKNSEKAMDPSKIIESLKDGEVSINQNLQALNDAIKGNASQAELTATNNAITEAFKQQAEINTQALKENTSNPEINATNQSLKEAAAAISKLTESQSKQEKPINEIAAEPLKTTAEAEKPTEEITNAVYNQVADDRSESDTKKLETENNAFEESTNQAEEEQEKINELAKDEIEPINKNISELNNNFQNLEIDSINKLVERKQKLLDEKEKEGNELKKSKKGGLFSSIKERASSLIKSKPSSNIIKSKVASISNGGETSGALSKGRYSLFKNKSTIAGVDKNDDIKNFDKKLTAPMMIDSKKKEGSVNDKMLQETANNGKTLKALVGTFGSFTKSYEKVSNENRERAIHKLRFGSGDKKKSFSFKLPSFPKIGEKVKSLIPGKGIFDKILGGIGAVVTFLFSGGGPIKILLKGITSFIKTVGKGLWSIAKFAGDLIWKISKWLLPKMWALIKWIAVKGGKLLGWLWKVIKGPLGSLFGKFGGLILKGLEFVWNIISKILGRFIPGFDKLGGVFKGLSGSLGKFTGGLGKMRQRHWFKY